MTINNVVYFFIKMFQVRRFISSCIQLYRNDNSTSVQTINNEAKDHHMDVSNNCESSTSSFYSSFLTRSYTDCSYNTDQKPQVSIFKMNLLYQLYFKKLIIYLMYYLYLVLLIHTRELTLTKIKEAPFVQSFLASQRFINTKKTQTKIKVLIFYNLFCQRIDVKNVVQ